MVVGEIGVGARRAEVRIVRDHPLVMDADALHPEGDELSVEERPLQKLALVFDPLAREAGELGLRTTISAGLADFGRTSLVPISGGLAARFWLVDEAVDAELVHRPHTRADLRTKCISDTLLVVVQSANAPAWVYRCRECRTHPCDEPRLIIFTTARTGLSSNRNSVGKPPTLSLSPSSFADITCSLSEAWPHGEDHEGEARVAVPPVSDRERFPDRPFTLRVSGANENGKIRASSDFFAVHAACFSCRPM